MVQLEDKTDLAVAEAREILVGKRREVLSGQEYFARRGAVERAHNVEERTLAGT